MKEFLLNYGWEIIGAIVSALFGYLAIAVKKLADKYLTDNTKKAIAKTVVQAVEQIYKESNGKEKLNIGIGYMTELLNEKGIKTSETEIRLLLEDAVGEFNEVFKKGE
jgi:LL-H family phage holin